MNDRDESIKVLSYNTETREIPEIVRRLTNNYSVEVEEVSDCDELDETERSVIVAYCSDCFYQIEKESPECIPVLGLTDSRITADRMVENGFDDYFLLHEQITDTSLKSLHNRLRTLHRSFNRDNGYPEEVDKSKFVEFAPDAFLIMNKDLSVRYMNKNSEVLSDVDKDFKTKEDVIELVHPEDRKAVKSDFQYLLDNQGEIVRTEFRIKSSEGEWIWLESAGQNLMDNEGINGVFHVVRNIDDRKKKEKEIERNRDRLDNVINIMSHDLRNLLNVGMARSEMIAEEHDDDNAKAVKESLDRMAELISDSLDIARTGRKVQEFESVNIKTLSRKCASNTVPDRTVVQCQDQMIIKADKSRVANLLENLFNNSVEHNSPDVRIRIGIIDEGFFVEDTGIGIDEDDQNKVFDRGFSSGSGSGLGLNIVKQVSDAHDWDINLTESEEGGARFEFTNIDIKEIV